MGLSLCQSCIACPSCLQLFRVCSFSKPNSHAELLEEQGVRTFQCAPNREDELADVLQQVNPAVCVFDRCCNLLFWD
jgi:hypothetical protein